MEHAAPITFREYATFVVGPDTRSAVTGFSFEHEPVLPAPSTRVEGGG